MDNLLYWPVYYRYIELAMIAEENLDLPFRFTERIVVGMAEVEAGLAEPVEWGQ